MHAPASPDQPAEPDRSDRSTRSDHLDQRHPPRALRQAGAFFAVRRAWRSAWRRVPLAVHVLLALVLVVDSSPWVAGPALRGLQPTPAFAQSAPAPEPAVYDVTNRYNAAVTRVSVDGTGHVSQDLLVSGLPAAGPDSIIFDHHGNVLVSNTEAGTISQIDPHAGQITRPTVNATPLPQVADLGARPVQRHRVGGRVRLPDPGPRRPRQRGDDDLQPQ